MSLTQRELDDFCEYAEAKIKAGSTASLSECVEAWQGQRQHAEDVAAIREAQNDIAAGRTKPAAQLEVEIREEFGLRPRQHVS